MSDRNEREDRALDALIASQLRRSEKCDEVDIEHLPRLTPEEKAGLESLGSDFIDRVIAGELASHDDDPPEEEDSELLCAGGMPFGMNRAEIDEETEQKLDEKRREIIERLKKDEENGAHDS